ncbi:MAG TPA: response regulator [Stellaceae bacterium]|nr:response regulator [Stellaceae bacterium]
MPKASAPSPSAAREFSSGLSHARGALTPGLEKFAGCAFDVVIADIFMPGEDGIGAIPKIRDQDPFVGIVAISGGGCAARLDRTWRPFRRGKPIPRARLLAVVTDADRLRRLRCA